MALQKAVGGKRHILWLPLIFILPFIIYANSLHNDFLRGGADDEEIILRNHYLRSWEFLPRYFTQNYKAGSGGISNFWRPFQLAAYRFIAQFAGIKPLPFHIASILFHALCGVFLYLILSRLFHGKNIPRAFIGSTVLLWLAHPIHNEELAVTSGIASPSYLFWMLLALYAFIRFKKGGRIGWYAVSLSGFAFSLFSKESAVIFPALLLGMHFFGARSGLFSKQGPAALFKQHAAFWLMSAFYVLSRLTFLNFSNTLNFYGQANIFTENFIYRLYTLFTVLVRGLKILFFPAGLHPESSWPVFTDFFSIQVLFSALILAALLILFAVNYKKRPLFAFGLFWLFVSYLPMSNLIAKINAIVWDHWFYAPSAGILFCLVSLAEGRNTRRAAFVILVPAIIIFSGLTISRNKYWKDTEAVSRFILRYEPRSAKTWNNLAISLDSKGQYMEAINHYLKAISISDTYAQSHHNLANTYLRLRQYDLAEKEYLKAIELDAAFYHSHAGLGNLYLMKGMEDRAADHFRKALAIYPYLPEIRKFLERNDR
ncbi:MAG: tetratricopeptide repeat protein [Candidatus Omnitrophica bacterium]|nr:tetratricopeptide repeat protein [Candidatus Omnitrophota bacterium]